MKIFNDDQDFGAIARFFHWVIAFLILGMLVLGLTMGSVNYGLPRHEVYSLHKSIGLLILFLAIGRILWRFASVPPDALETHAKWERALARIVHLFLYLAIFAMPITGWLMSSAAGRPPTFFGLPVPRFLEKDEALAGIFSTAHEWIAYGLIAVIGLHVAGAIKHHLIDKDATLRRMAGDKLQWFKTIFIVLVLDLVLSAAAFLFLKDTVMQSTVNEAGVARSAPVELPDISKLGAHEWMIDPRVSTLTFETNVMASPFTGHFNAFSGKIIFDPSNIQMARADIRIDMSETVTGDQSRDEMLKMSEWFSTAQFPESRFVTKTIEQMDGNRYVAVGDLTIRDMTLPVTLPFTLDFTQTSEVDQVHMQGEIVIHRLDFGVGQGEYQATESVDDEVRVTIDMQALKPRN